MAGWTLRVAAGVLLLFFLPLPARFAGAQQQAPSPRLQQRKQALAEDGIFLPGRTNLPNEASGAYALSPNPAEVIEIILNGEGDEVRLQGYLTRVGDGESDRGATAVILLRAHHGGADAAYLCHAPGAWNLVELCGNHRTRKRADQRGEGLLLPERNADGAFRYRPVGAATSQFTFASGGWDATVDLLVAFRGCGAGL